MQKENRINQILGSLLILVGLVLVVLPVLAWAGVFEPVGILAVGTATPWDVLLLLVQTIPWVAVLGLLLIYAGLKLLGIALPF
ncbi:MAG: hypothetical protein KF753_21975 [Caldilineaceae bacterium]|nr:hypothetical protein [Caldilineaceae bacterium]